MKITKLPSGNYHAEVQINGNRFSVTRRTAADVRKEIERLKDAKYPKTEPVTVSEAIYMYIDERTNVLSPSTINGYKEIARNRFKHIANSKIISVNWQRAINAEAALVSPKTLKNAFSLVKSAVEACGVQLHTNLRLPQKKPTERIFLQPDEILKLIELVKGKPYEAAVLLGLHGLRKSEIYALKKKDISDGVIRIRRSVVMSDHGFVEKDYLKTEASSRNVPVLIPRLMALVKKSKDRICTDAQTNTFKQLKKICEKNGLPPVSYHILRHSFASLAYHLQLTELETQKLGGWSNPATMRKIYTHLALEDRLNAEEKLRSFFV